MSSEQKSRADGEVLVRVEGVSKKFCRSLKKSLWYGLCDIGGELSPFGRQARGARQEVEGGGDGLRDGEFWAVNHVSFELRRGECLGLIGHNGAGKTTLLKMLNGLIKPDAGKITMRGRVGALIALGAGFNPILTGRENIYINGSVLGLSKKEIDEKVEDIIDFAEVREFIDMPVQNYSSGMQVRLGFAVATALQPDILLLDEVLAVGDMQFYAKCLNTVGRLRRSGTAFILVSHSMLNISRYCDRVAYMQHGRCEYLGPTDRGVAHYEKDMSLSEDSRGPSPTERQVAGSGKLRISDQYFTDKTGQRVRSIRSGEEVRFHIAYRKASHEPLSVMPELTLVDREGELHRYSGGKPVTIAGSADSSGTIVLGFPQMPVNSQLLEFSISLWDSEFAELFDWSREGKLAIEPVGKSTGRIHLPFEVSHHLG